MSNFTTCNGGRYKMTANYKKYRCKNCNRLLYIGNFSGIIKIKCNRCKQINIITERHERRHV